MIGRLLERLRAAPDPLEAFDRAGRERKVQEALLREEQIYIGRVVGECEHYVATHGGKLKARGVSVERVNSGFRVVREAHTSYIFFAWDYAEVDHARTPWRELRGRFAPRQAAERILADALTRL